MTVHNPSGTISQDMFWYNRWDSFMIRLPERKIDITKIRGKCRLLRRKIRKLPWREKRNKCLYAIITHSHISTWKIVS
jgi:hypothetical protein